MLNITFTEDGNDAATSTTILSSIFFSRGDWTRKISFQKPYHIMFRFTQCARGSVLRHLSARSKSSYKLVATDLDGTFMLETKSM